MPEADTAYRTDEAFARALDAADPLRHTRDLFHIPPAGEAAPAAEAAFARLSATLDIGSNRFERVPRRHPQGKPCPARVFRARLPLAVAPVTVKPWWLTG